MADRIFPNTYQEEPLDSDLVFKGINWDNFNTKLAEVQNNGISRELPEEFREVLAGKNDDDGHIPQEVLDKWNDKKPKSKGDISKLPGDKDSGLEGYVRKHKKGSDDEEKPVSEEHDESSDKSKTVKAKECTCGKKPCTCGWAASKKNTKEANTIVFNHPSQLSAEAVEAAIAEGNQELANAILAARHERRIRLANKIETRIAEETDRNIKLAQRKAYRESLVKKASESEKQVKTSKSENTAKTATQSADGFVKVSSLDAKSRKVFAQKALAQGFPQEYVDAILGETTEVQDKTVDIRKVMSSDLSSNVKKAAVESMVRTATLTNADYSRLINYWKNELGYGDQEWIEALFTKKYD